jgi:SAM-dependent methyltransferase
MSEPFRFACPSCKSALLQTGPDELSCPVDGTVYTCEEGIWRFLTPQKNLEYWQFIQEYEAIRSAEGRGSNDPAYYRDLPFRDRTRRHSADWKVRCQSYRALFSSVIVPMERARRRPLKVLDIGAGNGWLSYRLTSRGHQAAAVDLQTNRMDGLGAHIHYDADFLPIQADFNHLPLSEGQADLAIFNASFHYSTNYLFSLCEALRVLHPEGEIVILDTPIYHDSQSGEMMVREREEFFKRNYGFPSDAIPSENYLTFERLNELGSRAGIQWRLVNVYYGLGWALRPLRARLSGSREPAQFRIAIGSRVQNTPA